MERLRYFLIRCTDESAALEDLLQVFINGNRRCIEHRENTVYEPCRDQNEHEHEQAFRTVDLNYLVISRENDQCRDQIRVCDTNYYEFNHAYNGENKEKPAEQKAFELFSAAYVLFRHQIPLCNNVTLPVLL